jgi:CheY-like chemotaxis protein
VGPASALDEALTFARDSDIDGAFLDLNLGGESSFAVADILRARNIPFVFASGDGPRDHGGKFDDVHTVQKPFEISAIASALRHIDAGKTF